MSSVAFFLPGQGAQAVGMGKAFYDRFQESRDIYKRAGARLGFDVAAMCFEGLSLTPVATIGTVVGLRSSATA